MKTVRILLVAAVCVLLLGSAADNYGMEDHRTNRIKIGRVTLSEAVILDAVYGQARLVHRLCEFEGKEPGDRLDLDKAVFLCRETNAWFGDNSIQDRQAFYRRFKSGEYMTALNNNSEKHGWDGKVRD